jgi:hypothetical protein
MWNWYIQSWVRAVSEVRLLEPRTQPSCLSTSGGQQTLLWLTSMTRWQRNKKLGLCFWMSQLGMLEQTENVWQLPLVTTGWSFWQCPCPYVLHMPLPQISLSTTFHLLLDPGKPVISLTIALSLCYNNLDPFFLSYK